MFRSLRHPVEALRTAPAQFSGLVVSASAALYCGTSALETTGTPNSLIMWGVTALNVGAAAMNGVLVKGRLDLRDRIEDILDEYGYDDRIMNATTRTYCSRQAARIACENYGVIDEYKELCDKAEDKQLAWLPHV